MMHLLLAVLDYDILQGKILIIMH